MKIALISPKGPLYRHRGGIFRSSLRYAPLTLTTLASLVPPELDAELRLIDEGIAGRRSRPARRSRRHHGDHRHGAAGLRAGRRTSARGASPVVLGGPHVTLVPDDAQPHADAIVVGYAEDTWPELLRDFAAGRAASRATSRRPGLSLAGRAVPAPRSAAQHGASSPTTSSRPRAAASTTASSASCPPPGAASRTRSRSRTWSADIRQHGARKLIFVDLNLIADRDYAARLFEALIPLEACSGTGWPRCCWPTTRRCSTSRPGAAAAGCSSGFESISPENLRGSSKGFNTPDAFKRRGRALHAHGIALQGCFVFGMDDDTPDVFLETARFAVEAQIDLPRFAIVTPFPGTALYKRLEREGRILTRNWELYDGQHVVFQPAG